MISTEQLNELYRRISELEQIISELKKKPPRAALLTIKGTGNAESTSLYSQSESSYKPESFDISDIKRDA